jgi:hypothetical protein
MMFDKLIPDVLPIIENNLDDLHYSLTYSRKILKIPRHADNQTVRSHVQRFKKFLILGMPVQIDLIVNHLSILKDECPSLQHIIVKSYHRQHERDQSIIDPFMNELSSYRNLKKLRIHRVDAVSDGSSLSNLNQLTSFELFDCHIWNIAFVASMPLLTSINLSHDGFLADLSPLSGLEYLTELDLSGIRLRTLEHLTGLDRLRKLREIFNDNPLFLRLWKIKHSAPLAIPGTFTTRSSVGCIAWLILESVLLIPFSKLKSFRGNDDANYQR